MRRKLRRESYDARAPQDDGDRLGEVAASQYGDHMRLAPCLMAFAFVIGPLSINRAQAQADFYKGKTVDLMIGYSVGGGYDVYARLIARHLGKHIPGNPIVTPKNMEGAGSLRLANWLYNVASKEGLVFGTIGRGTGFDPLLGSKTAQFDGTKFNWIGSANDEVSVCVVWNGRGKVTKFDDLLTQELVVVERGGHPQDLDNRQENHHPHAALAQEAPRSSGRSAHCRLGEDRRAAADSQAHLRAAAAGTPVPRATRRTAGPRRYAAQGVRGYDDGQGFPRRSRQGTTRNYPNRRGEPAEARDRGLPDPARHRPEGGGNPAVSATSKPLHVMPGHSASKTRVNALMCRASTSSGAEQVVGKRVARVP